MRRIGFLWGKPERYRNYQKAVRQAGGELHFGNSTELCDFLLLPGGGDLEPWRYGQENTASRDLDPERDAVELELIDRFITLRKPVFGVCRGLQILNVFFGGTLLQDIPGHHAVCGIDRHHKVWTAASPIRELCGAEMIVNSAHHQAVDRLGTGLDALQWAADGTVEAICHQTLPVWAVQWHPERLDNPVRKDIFSAAVWMEP